jgi:hypothetical protein
MALLTKAQIMSGTKGNIDLQNAMLAMYEQFELLNKASGTNFLAPVNSSQQPATAPPAQAALSVTGANGVFSGKITPAAQSVTSVLYHEVSFSPVSNFSSGVTTLPITSSTSFTYPSPGQGGFWRLRSSFDKKNWNAFMYQGGIVNAGLQTSSASANNVPLNQSNYANLDSVDNGAGSANVRVFGQSGPGFMYPAVKGSAEKILPSATIINVPFSSNPVVAYDGAKYMVKSTLPQVFADEITPTGSLSVVGAGAVTLPTITPIEFGGGIIGYDVTSPGNGLTADVVIAIVGSGTGATAGAQVIVGGQLISVSPGNAGNGYGSGTTATVSGGTFAGGVGGGQSIGGNNGRFVYADPTTGAL